MKPFEKDLWFRLHQAFMTSAVVLTILGILVILSDKGLEPFKSVDLNPHPIFGLFVFLGALAQPIMAFFRPHPGTDYRYYFKLFPVFFAFFSYVYAY